MKINWRVTSFSGSTVASLPRLVDSWPISGTRTTMARRVSSSASIPFSASSISRGSRRVRAASNASPAKASLKVSERRMLRFRHWLEMRPRG